MTISDFFTPSDAPATIRGGCALQLFMRFEYCSLFSGYVLGVESGALFADSAQQQIERAHGFWFS
jgi:hypothetical protein